MKFALLLAPAAALCLCSMTGCSPAQKLVMGDPEAPYRGQSPPRTSDIVHLPTGTVVSLPQMLSVAGDARIVYIGEVHDNPAVHRLEEQVLQGLDDLHPGSQAIGMEMFVRSQQPVLDRWLSGDMDEKQFLRELHWFENWGMDFDYYRDLLYLARDRKIPVIALNAEKSLVESLRSKPADQLAAEEQAKLPEMDLADSYQRGLVTAIFGGHSHGSMALDGFIRAQTLRDEAMAESVAKYLTSPAGRDKHLLVVAGGHHVSHGFGIPRRVFRRLPASYVLIGGEEINVPPDKQDRLMDVDIPKFPMPPYDFVVYQDYENLPGKGVKLGVMIEPSKTGGVVVKMVVPGSNAERAGVEKGDIIHSMDGEALGDNLDLIYAVKRKKQGEQGTLQVERQGGQLELHVLFQSTDSARDR